MADTQTVTVTWSDPVVGPGQAALKSLQIYSALVSGGPNTLLGTVNPGVQTFTSAAGQLAPGTAYYFTVAATDINGEQGPDGTYFGPLTTSAVPSAPTNVQATLSA